MVVLGKEAAAALSAVEAQQRRLTFQRIVAMVGGNSSHIALHISLVNVSHFLEPYLYLIYDFIF